MSEKRIMTTDAQVLAALRGTGDDFLPLAELSRRLGLSRAFLDGRLAALGKLGYEIEFSPHLGCRLVASPDRLHADDLLGRLNGKGIVGRDIRVFEETTSTND